MIELSADSQLTYYDPDARTYAPSAAEPWWLSGGVAAGDCVAAYQPKGAASLLASYVNLSNPGVYDAAPGLAPSWAISTGWTFDGATQYLTTGIVTADNWSVVVRFSGLLNAGVFIILGSGVFVPERFFRIGGNAAAQSYFYNGSSSVFIDNSPILSGTYAISQKSVYKNGSPSGTIPAGASGGAHLAAYLGANNSGSASLHCLCNILAVAFYSVPISSAQVAAISAAAAAL